MTGLSIDSRHFANPSPNFYKFEIWPNFLPLGHSGFQMEQHIENLKQT